MKTTLLIFIGDFSLLSGSFGIISLVSFCEFEETSPELDPPLAGDLPFREAAVGILTGLD